jgi:hypothetical protein
MNTELRRQAPFDRASAPKPRELRESEAGCSLYDQIEHSIGDGAADKLIADFGGRRLYIPMAPAQGDVVTRSIGLAAATAMARMFGGDRLLIPVTSDHARRRVRIVALRAEHLSISRIAHELRCTERYVYKVLAEKRGTRIAAEARVAPPGASSAHRMDPHAHQTSAPAPHRLNRGNINGR